MKMTKPTTTTGEQRKRRLFKGTAYALLSFCVVMGVHLQIKPPITAVTAGQQEKRNLSSFSSSSSLMTTQQSKALQAAIAQAPIGSLGPKNSNRHNLLYYDFLFMMSILYGSNAKSLLEVGCASDPFAQYLNWMEKRSCLAPYFASYQDGKHTSSTTQSSSAAAATNSLQHIQADFMKWDNPNKESYDLIVCNQVLEHVPDPKSFLQKLITTSKQTTIISVPYMWADCGKSCGHLHHGINYDTILEWAYPFKPIHHSIITEPNDKDSRYRRIFAIFQHDNDDNTNKN